MVMVSGVQRQAEIRQGRRGESLGAWWILTVHDEDEDRRRQEPGN